MPGFCQGDEQLSRGPYDCSEGNSIQNVDPMEYDS